MESLAIGILVLILVLGGVIFYVFLQFLAVSKENRERYEEIANQLADLDRKMTKLATPAASEKSGSPPSEP